MVNRRIFIQRLLAAGGLGALTGCGKEWLEKQSLFLESPSREDVILYDTYAMATYFDGGLGPKTGIIKVDYILKGEALTLKFWHGHGGVDHKFTLLPEHYADFIKKKKVWIQTTIVDNHSHKLFIDFSDAKWRVPGAAPITVPVPVPVPFPSLRP